jgi:hypothetical protein
MGKLTIFRRDTERDLNWLDLEHGVFDEVWRRRYTLFGVVSVDLSYVERNNLQDADARSKRPVSGFASGSGISK